MTIVVPEKRIISAGAEDGIDVDFTPWLKKDPATGALTELLASITASEQTTSHLTLSNKAPNDEAIIVIDKTCVAGAVATFFGTGWQAGITYQILVTGTTDSVPARKLPVIVVVECV